ncbi:MULTISPECIES: RHS repeat-associated core domain-containing protein [unclassified Arthrobacter]|uniref:RHS repeat domain-containing protein n=1 Tax=unclassified Arthrobacter TaxID=235627 RepID=UPI0028831D7F|nr:MULTISPECIES: RHS repeat-associated core domain-containing protein [unclassified Arthrobacter]
MRTPKYLALPLKALLTGTLTAALILSGSAFTAIPEPASTVPTAAEATAREVEPIPVQAWTEQPPPAPAPSGVDATAAPAPADTVIDGTTNASTVALQTARAPMLATVPGNANGTSNFTAVPGVGSGSWGTTGQTGGFTWNYPFPIREAPAGKTPSLGLSYDSTRLDGLTSATNTQASVVGDGWGLSGTGSIRQEFGSCKDQLPAGTPTWDLCGNPGGQKFSITFGSRSGLIIEDPNQTDPKLKYRLQNDDGSRLEYLTGAGNGTYAGDYWILTDPEGTRYFFGVDKLPGWTSATQNTNSTDYVPVRAANSGQPCSHLLSVGDFCQQAYAWNLAYVVDVHDNSQAFYYTRDTNFYHTKAGTGPTYSYVRASRLARVDYGMRAGSELTAKAPMVVHFGYTGRCEQGVDCSAGNDVPYEEFNCPTASGCPVQAPTFYTHYRLLSVLSQTLVNGTSYGNTDYWSLVHTMPDPLDVVGARPALWFKSITHSGANTTTSNSTSWVTDPATLFDGRGKKNRVWDVRSGQPTMNRIRLTEIINSTGATTAVEYMEPNCTNEDVDQDGNVDIVPENNTKMCFPQWWVPTEPIVQPAMMSYFNVYPVKQVTTTPSPGVDGSTPLMTRYEYNGQLVWKYAGPKIDTSTGGSKKTWSVFGGWPEVKTITGNDPVQSNNPYTLTTYFRGNDGTPANTSGTMRSVSLTTSDGTATVRDSPWFAGRVFEKRSYRGTGGTYMTGTVSYPWNSQYPTATASAALGSVKAYFTGTGWTQTQIASGQGSGWRKTKTTNGYDSLGRVISVSDDGELGTLTDDSCTTTSYADNTGLNILSLPAVTSTYSSVCNTPGVSILKSTRTLYDTSTSAVPGSTGYVAPTNADKTRVDTATSVSGANVTVWQTGPTTIYDALGRPTQSTDNSTGAPRVTKTAYSPATGPVTTVTTTNAANWQPTVTTLDAIRGNTLKTVDQNGHETSAKYDPSGREVASWDVRRPQGSNPDNPTVATSYSVSQTSPSWVKKTVMNGRQQTTEKYTVYDGMGRVRQTQSQSPGGGAIVTDTTYNSAGNKDLVRNPYYVYTAPNGVLVTPSIAVPSSILFDYDAYGRVAAERAMAWDNDELWKTQHTYAGIDTTTTTVTSDTGFTKSPVRTVVNTDGKVQSRTLYYGTTATGSADVSSYIYDVFGQLTRMGDGYNLWTWAYDAAGRQIASEDPDTGTSSIVYDAAGRIASRTDELNTVTKSSYDVLDRITKQTVTPSGGTEKTLITNTYDGTGNPKGVLASSTRNNGDTFNQPVTTTYSGFDLAYTPGTTVTTLPAGLTGFGSTSYTFTNTTTFTGKTDVAGTPAVAGLPAETVTNGYDTFDNPSELRGGSNYYVASGSYNHLNQIASYTQYDNNDTTGVNTTGKNKITFNWDAATGRLTDTAATNKINSGPTTTDLGTTRYTYDPAGRITEREQAYTTRLSPQTDSQCYSYDHADRIKAVWTPANTSCGTAPATTATTVAGLGGPAPYAQTYTYTAAGDRSQVKRFSSNGNLASTEDYAYPAAGTVGPHRLQSITTTPAGGTAVARTITWDTAGRMTGRAGQVLSYTLDGRLDTTTGISTVPTNPNPNATAGTPPAAPTGIADDQGARYYDAAGNLVGITDGTGTTITLGSITAHHNTATGTKSATKTYTFAGKVVAQRTTSGSTTKLAFIVGDSVNTAQTMTLPNTTAGTQITTLVRRTDPLGLARGANSTGNGNAAFTAGANTTAGTGSNAANVAGFGAVNGYIAGLDDTASSLTHLGARELDPVLGVFTAPDPILNTEDQRGFTPYTYAFGNVINGSDPTGLAIQIPICDICSSVGPVSAPNPAPSTPAPAAPPITQPTNTSLPGNMDLYDDADLGAITGYPTANDAAKLGMGPMEGLGFGLSLGFGSIFCIATGVVWCLGGTLAGSGAQMAGKAADGKEIGGEDAGGAAVGAAAAIFCKGCNKFIPKTSLKGAEGPLGVHLKLTYMDGWSAAQKAAADSKVANLNNAFLEATKVERTGSSASTMWGRAGNTKPAGADIDHIIDLQLGGSNTLDNMSPLDLSVNRSLGSQIAQQLKGVPTGTPICGVSICTR